MQMHCLFTSSFDDQTSGRGRMKASQVLPLLIFLLMSPSSMAGPAPPEPASSSSSSSSPEETCNGVFLSYVFISREKEYPRVKNASAQPWAFKSMATLLNTGTYEIKAWRMFVGFQHEEILVSALGATLMGGEDFPVSVGNGISFSGYPQTDLKTSIDTAGDLSSIQVQIEIKGTQFGLRPPSIPMPRTISLQNDGYTCLTPSLNKTMMYACCTRSMKTKIKPKVTRFLPRQEGDLSITYDVMQAYEGNYLAQVTLDNRNPLGRLDRWNLTWEWMRGEFIQSMRGAYTYRFDYTDCIYGPASDYYQSMDFSKVMNCDKNPVITDMPPEKSRDDNLGNLQFCCRNGSLLPSTMNVTKSKAVFQLQVFKIPPDINRTTLYPPEKWKLQGILNPDYTCAAPLRVDSTEFPHTNGLNAITTALASWQVVCNITAPRKRASRCCVSYSAFYSDSVVPCRTCACGCEEAKGGCDPGAAAMRLPAEALLLPFENRKDKAKAWAHIKRRHIPERLPCGDNCGVSINWHISTDYRKGWTARMTLFNWEEVSFEDWFVAVQLEKAYAGYENVYSFNGTRLPRLNKTVFFQGLPGMNYLMGERNGSNPKKDPRIPGKQQSVISFSKRGTPGIEIGGGDGFPTKLFFNGEECALPLEFPRGGAGGAAGGLLWVLLLLEVVVVILLASFY